MSCLQECPTRYPTRVSYKGVRQECFARVSYKSVPQGCPTRIVRQECPARVPHKSVLQESVKICLGACFRVRVCIRVRVFHLVNFLILTPVAITFAPTDPGMNSSSKAQDRNPHELALYFLTHEPKFASATLPAGWVKNVSTILGVSKGGFWKQNTSI